MQGTSALSDETIALCMINCRVLFLRTTAFFYRGHFFNFIKKKKKLLLWDARTGEKYRQQAETLLQSHYYSNEHCNALSVRCCCCCCSAFRQATVFQNFLLNRCSMLDDFALSGVPFLRTATFLSGAICFKKNCCLGSLFFSQSITKRHF